MWGPKCRKFEDYSPLMAKLQKIIWGQSPPEAIKALIVCMLDAAASRANLYVFNALSKRIKFSDFYYTFCKECFIITTMFGVPSICLQSVCVNFLTIKNWLYVVSQLLNCLFACLSACLFFYFSRCSIAIATPSW